MGKAVILMHGKTGEQSRLAAHRLKRQGELCRQRRFLQRSDIIIDGDAARLPIIAGLAEPRIRPAPELTVRSKKPKVAA